MKDFCKLEGAHDRNRRRGGGPPKFVDFFAGIGGASEGAAQAGYDVVLAVDADQAAMELHALNHPQCTHLCCTLPPTGPLPLPSAETMVFPSGEKATEFTSRLCAPCFSAFSSREAAASVGALRFGLGEVSGRLGYLYPTL